MRLIDADELLNNTDGLEHVKWSQEYGHVVLVCDIVYAPTVEAVEVVRCKECRYANECHKSVQYTRSEPNMVTIGYSPIEWCSRGKRRDDAEIH